MAIIDRDQPRQPPALALPHATMAQAFVATATTSPHGVRVLTCDRTGVVTPYRALGELAGAYAAGLIERGVAPGDRVVLGADSCVELIAAFFAVQLIGAIPVPTYPPSILDSSTRAALRLVQVTSSARPSLALTQGALFPAFAAAPLTCPLVSFEHLAAAAPLDLAELGRRADAISPDAPAFIQYTSGSTRAPRGAVIAHRALMAQLSAGMGTMAVTPAEVNVSWLPLFHDMGLVWGLCWPLSLGFPLVLMSPLAFLLDPMRWLHAISDHRGTVTSAPNFALARIARRLDPRAAAGLDLASLRLIVIGAEPLSERTARGFADALSPYRLRRGILINAYGMAEMTLAVAGTLLGEDCRFERVDRAALAAGRALPSDAPDAIEVAALGVPIPGHAVKVCGPDGAELPDRQVGELWLSGGSRMTGYFEDPAATAEVLRGEWLRSGDLGYVADRTLFLSGRASDVIIVHGATLHPIDVEEPIEALTGVRGGGCVALPDRAAHAETDGVAILCETTLPPGPAREALAEQIAGVVLERFAVRPGRLCFLAPRSLPRTSSGKKQRRAARALLDGYDDDP